MGMYQQTIEEMKDFIFRNDTKLLFRNDIRTAIAEIAQGHKVMVRLRRRFRKTKRLPR